MEEAVKAVRGTRKITNPNAEATYDALNKYGHDLVKDAEDGKLDPVIGRDAEIRRVIQVLSRRTKNNPVLIGEPGVGQCSAHEQMDSRHSARAFRPSAALRISHCCVHADCLIVFR